MKKIRWNDLKIKESADEKHFEHDSKIFIHEKDLKLKLSDNFNEFVMKKKYFKKFTSVFFNIIHIVHSSFRSRYHFYAFFQFCFIHVSHSFLFFSFIFFISVFIQFCSRFFRLLKNFKTFFVNLVTDIQNHFSKKVNRITLILFFSKNETEQRRFYFNWHKFIIIQFFGRNILLNDFFYFTF